MLANDDPMVFALCHPALIISKAEPRASFFQVVVTLLHGPAFCFFPKHFRCIEIKKQSVTSVLCQSVDETKLSLWFLGAWRLYVLQNNLSCCCDLEYRHGCNVVKDCVCLTPRYESTCSICRGLAHLKVTALNDYEITPHNLPTIAHFQMLRVYKKHFCQIQCTSCKPESPWVCNLSISHIITLSHVRFLEGIKFIFSCS